MNAFFSRTAAASAVIVTLAWTGPARAQDVGAPYSDAPSEVVQYRNSETTTTEGANALYNRIHGAARRVCSDIFPLRDAPSALSNLNCVRTLIDDAVKDVNSPRLTAVYEQREGAA